MTLLINYIRQRLLSLDFTNPLVYLDLLAALFLMVGFLVYMRRFPSFRVILGTFFLIACSVILIWGGFLFTGLVFGFASVLVLVSLPLIFSSEIRHYLGKLGRFSYLRPAILESQKKERFIRDLVGAVYELAERKIGGTIVVARKTGLEQTIETGVILDAVFGAKLLRTIFFASGPLHDGAVIIRDGRVLAAACLLPVSSEIKLDPPLGTRHRAGLSITRDTDTVVIIISEQRGEVSLAENGKLEINLERAILTEKLTKLL